MREIKFRAKNYGGIWLYGYLMPAEKPAINIGCKYRISVSPQAGAGKDKIVYEVITDTIGQFTGLHDKNGKEIYEGDVLFVREWKNIAMEMFDHEEREQLSLDDCKGELLHESQRVVYFEEGSMCAGDYYISSLWDQQDRRHQYPIFEVEVIGNIHDNPELLKKQENSYE